MATPLTIKQGMPFRLLVRVTRKNEENVSVPMELTGCTVKMQARIKTSDSVPVLDLSSPDSITVDEDAGTFAIEMTAEETAALVWGRRHVLAHAVYQCEISPPNGEDFRALEGTLTLDPEVVR